MTALMDLESMSSAMYTSGVADAPDLEKNIPINEARNLFGKIVERSRYFDGVTYLTNRGKRVAAIVPVEVAERYEAEQAKPDA